MVGWIKRGPQGIIGTNKPDSYETVDSLLDGPRAPAASTSRRSPPARCSSACSRERRRDFVSYEDWQLSTCSSRSAAQPAGAPRLKFSRVEEMLRALQERKRAAAEEAAREAG